MNHRYLIAIVICNAPGEDPKGMKFHNIRNTEAKIEVFMNFARQLPNAGHVNFYFVTDTTAEYGKNFAFQRKFDSP